MNENLYTKLLWLLSVRHSLNTLPSCTDESPYERLHGLRVPALGAARRPCELVRHVLKAKVLPVDAHLHQLIALMLSTRLRLESVAYGLPV